MARWLALALQCVYCNEPLSRETVTLATARLLSEADDPFAELEEDEDELSEN